LLREISFHAESFTRRRPSTPQQVRAMLGSIQRRSGVDCDPKSHHGASLHQFDPLSRIPSIMLLFLHLYLFVAMFEYCNFALVAQQVWHRVLGPASALSESLV
jgi:hypothetical protein